MEEEEDNIFMKAMLLSKELSPNLLKKLLVAMAGGLNETRAGMPVMNKPRMLQAMMEGEDITDIMCIGSFLTLVRNLQEQNPDWTDYMDPELRIEAEEHTLQ